MDLGPHLADLTELLARHTHDVWARLRFAQGWEYGPARDDANKRHPCLVPYEQLPESEKEFDRATAIGTLKAIVALGYDLVPGSGEAPRFATNEGDEVQLLELLKSGQAPGLQDLQTIWSGHRDNEWAAHPELYYLFGRQLARLGAPFLAHEVAAEGLRFRPRDVPLRQLAANSLARAGSPGRANQIMQGLYDEGHRDEETLGILGRTHKDLALGAGSAQVRQRHLQRAFETYRDGFSASGGSYTGINAATMALLSSRVDETKSLAQAARSAALREMEQHRAAGAPYFQLATLGEAALLLGDEADAARWYREAASAGRGLWGALASTRRNARLILEQQGRRNVLDELLPIPKVVVFSGHRVDSPERANPRFPAAAEFGAGQAIRQKLDAIGAGFGFAGAAAGGDLLFHEAMLARGGEISIVLPYPEAEFLEDSVLSSAGGGWGDRFARILSTATDVTVATGGRFVEGGILHQYANDLLLGMAAIRAAELDTTVVPLVLWDGKPGDGPGGTASAAEDWRRRGYPVEVLDLNAIARLPAGSGSTPGRSRKSAVDLDTRIMGVLFADVVNFSKLSDVEIPRFVEHFLGGVAALRSSPDAPVISNTWGDGLYFVFEDVGSAGRWALDLSEMVTGTDWSAKGLPADLNLRVALHAGPLFRCLDPVTNQPNFTGKQVVPAARLEPVTPPGLVYASREFAAIAAAERSPGFECQPVGRVGLAKKAGAIPVYVVSRR